MTDSPTADCPFCNLPPDRVLAANEHALALADAYPVSAGHTLFVARRHVAGFFDLSAAEMAAVLDLLTRMKARLDASHAPHGYNVGVNVGPAAGQTVFHVHVHLIPRYPGDVPDPAGGVRNVLPGRGRYTH